MDIAEFDQPKFHHPDDQRGALWPAERYARAQFGQGSAALVWRSVALRTAIGPAEEVDRRLDSGVDFLLLAMPLSFSYLDGATRRTPR